MPANFFITKAHFDVLEIEGSDAARFLQGQLTCDVMALPDPGCCYGATLNNKGRVIAPFLLARAQDRFLLIFNQGLARAFLGHLEKFLPFYKCRMHTPSDLPCTILYSPQALAMQLLNDTALPHSGLGKPVAEGMYFNTGNLNLQAHLLIGAAANAVSSRPDTLAEGNTAQWHLATTRGGHFPFVPEDSGLYTPQEIRLDTNGYVNFEKGCYTGQEIVARMHYRSTPKKQLYRIEFHWAADTTLTSAGYPEIKIAGQTASRFLKLLASGENSWCGLAPLPVGIEPESVQIADAEVVSLGPL